MHLCIIHYASMHNVLGPLLWNIFINDFNPSIAHIKYADDVTLYHPLNKGECLMYESTAHQATISYADSSPVQLALDYTSRYCKENHLNLNVRKSTSMNFTLQKSISIPPFVVAEESLAQQHEVKLLGVTFQQHHKFDCHVNNVIDKTKSASHAIVRLKRSGVNSFALALFYRARVLSVLSYAAPLWYPHITDKCKDKLEKHQRYCTRLMLSDEDDYETRLSILKLDELNVHLQILCFRYVAKVSSNDDHPCNPFLTKDHHSYNRTTLLDDNIFNKFT